MDRMWAFLNSRSQLFDRSKIRLNRIIGELSNSHPFLIHKGSARIVNIGAGDGYLERTATKFGWNMESVDPHEPTVESLRKDGITAHLAGAEKLPFQDRSIHAVIATEILEHLDDNQLSSAIREIARVMPQMGTFIGTVPHAENLAEATTACPSCGTTFHRWGHKQSFTKERVREMLSPHFHLSELRRTVFVPFGVKGIMRLALAKLGSPIAIPSIWWVARRL